MDDPAAGARRALRDRFGTGDGRVRVASAPGRVNLVGGHTDYNDGLVLPVAVDRRVAVAARRRDDGRLRASSTAFDGDLAVALDDPSPGEVSGWGAYVAGVARALRTAGHPVPGADLAVHADLPAGVGLASSAALTVAAGAALAAAGGVDVPDRDLVDAAHRAEREFVGVDCGVMDQFAAVRGRADTALALDCRDREFEAVPLDPGAVRLVVVDTGVTHDLAESAYNRRRASCRRGAALLDDAVGGVDALRDVSVDTFESHRDALPATVADRCEHVVRENRRVRRAADALRAGEYGTVGDLLFDAHRSLRDLFEVSCEEADAVVDLARGTDGVLGARLTGGGFGGSVVALARPGAVGAFRERVTREYPDVAGVEPSVLAVEPAAGCRVK